MAERCIDAVDRSHRSNRRAVHFRRRALEPIHACGGSS